MSAIYLPFVLLAIAAMPVARTETTAATQGFVTIVRMNNGAEVFTCAGALVAPDFVLTTAHCFCKGSKSCKTSAADYRALVGSNEYASTVAIEIRTISIHPAWTGDPSGGFDFAAVRLKEVANEVTDQARAVPIVMSHDRYCYDTLVQAYSWDGDELIRINGNTSDDQVGSRLVNETNKLLVNSTITYSWPQVCEQSNCEATQVVARGTSGSFCLLNDGAPLMLAGNGAEETGLVGLYSWALSSPPSNSSNSSDSACILKLKDGSVVSQFFAQASAAVEFLEAQGARLRVPVGPVCGDGRKSLYEACDDGNAVSGDGCSSNCTIESGWQCSTYHKTNLEQCWRSQCSSLKDDGDGSGLIVGIVVGCIAGAMALCAIPTIIIRRRRRERAAAKATTRATPAPPAAGATTTDRNPRRTTRKAPEDLPVIMAENTDTLVSTPVTALKHGAPPPTPAADPIWTAGSPTAPSASTVGLPENGSRVLTPAALRLDTPASPGNARTAASGGNRLAGIVRPTPVRSDNAPLSPFRRDSTDSQSRSPLTSSRD